MPHRSFTVPATEEEAAPREPITFELAAQTFTCLLDPPLRVNLDLIRAGQEMTRSPQDAQGALNVLAWDNFIMGVLVPEDRERFRELTAQPSFRLADVQIMAEIFAWLQEQYTGRPTPSPVGSSNGQQLTGDISPAAAPSQESTPDA